MSIDGQDSEPMAATTGLPQGSPISPVPFALYIAEIHGAVEGQVEDSRGTFSCNGGTTARGTHGDGEGNDDGDGSGAATVAVVTVWTTCGGRKTSCRLESYLRGKAPTT